MNQSAEQANKTIVNVQNLTLTLTSSVGEVKILRGVNFAMHQGEHLALVGPSGSGKSSLLFVLAGLEPPTSGQVLAAGTDLGTAQTNDLTRHRSERVGVVFQNFLLIPTMTALENVILPLELAGHKDIKDRASEMLQAVGLEHRKSHFPAQLSGGEQQRVAIARALVGSPQLILADEPTGNLDGDTGERVMEVLFEQTRERNSSLLIVTHDPGIAATCDRSLTMMDGQITE